MKLLILGGTRFLGRHLVEAALARGHELSLFNRGQSNPGLFHDVEKLRGDRDGGLDALKGRRWDAVIDTSGYVPRVVLASAQLLADSVNQYLFISSISVYDEPDAGSDEDAPVLRLQDETVEEITGESYGGLKVLCEQAVEQTMPGRAFHIRAGLIVGPHDPTDRFTYWPVRLARGGEVMAPGRPERRIQHIDVRDLSEWIVRMAESAQNGIYNATGPDYTLTMGEFLETCRDVAGSDAALTWVGEGFLLQNGVAPFTELPLWIPDADNGVMAVSISKACKAGLTFRPLADTVRDTLAWHASLPPDREWRAGLKPEREAELLQARNAAQQPGSQDISDSP